MSVNDLVVEVHEILESQEIRHAIGGALALNFYAAPRFTGDVDVNVAVPSDKADGLLALFATRGFVVDQSGGVPPPAADARLQRTRNTVDLFFAFSDFHEKIHENAVIRSIRSSSGSVDVPFLSANDLVVAKLSFNRDKDWVDIDSMLIAGTPIDVGYVQEQLVAFRGPTMYPRIAVLRQRVPKSQRLNDRPAGEIPSSTVEFDELVTGTIGAVASDRSLRRPDSHTRVAASTPSAKWVTSRVGFRSHRVSRRTADSFITQCGQQIAASNAAVSDAPSGTPCPRCRR